MTVLTQIISYNKNESIFKIKSDLNNSNFEVKLNYPGKHNIYNALAASIVNTRAAEVSSNPCALPL